MPVELGGPVPAWVLSPAAVATLFVIMFRLGTLMPPREYRSAWRDSALMAKGLFANLVLVPVVVIVIARAFGVPRAAEIGMVLMSISPGAPVALRRALAAGGLPSFALGLQVALAILAVASMPLSIAALDEVYAGHATAAPENLARQVLLAQLLPLGLGIAARHYFGGRLAPLDAHLARAGAVLLALFALLILADIWETVIGTGGRVAAAIATACLIALALGHSLGGPGHATRTALAVSCAARNAGLAMLVASLNSASPAIMATLLAYLVVSALTVTPYLAWRRRSAP